MSSPGEINGRGQPRDSAERTRGGHGKPAGPRRVSPAATNPFRPVGSERRAADYEVGRGLDSMACLRPSGEFGAWRRGRRALVRALIEREARRERSVLPRVALRVRAFTPEGHSEDDDGEVRGLVFLITRSVGDAFFLPGRGLRDELSVTRRRPQLRRPEAGRCYGLQRNEFLVFCRTSYFLVV